MHTNNTPNSNVSTPKKIIIRQDNGQPAKATLEQAARFFHPETQTDTGPDLAQKRKITERRLETVTLFKSALGNSPVAGPSVYSRKKIPEGERIYKFTDDDESAGPYVAAAPKKNELSEFINPSVVRDYAKNGHKIAVENSNITTDVTDPFAFLMMYNRNPDVIYTAARDIESGEIITKDYLTLQRQGPALSAGLMKGGVAANWVKEGATPELMTTYGEKVPDIQGKVYTHFITGIEVSNNNRQVRYERLSPDTRLDPNQEIIGEIGTTLYAYDVRLHQAYKTSETTITYGSTSIVNVFYPPQFLKDD